MRGTMLWGDVQLGRWDASAKGWSGMCGILVGISLLPPVHHRVLPNTILLCKTQCSLARPCTSSPFHLHVYLACKRAGEMKGKGLGELKSDSKEGEGEFASLW